MEITHKFLETKGLSSKEIKEYFKNLKQLRKAINEDTNLDFAQEKMFELDGGLRFFYQIWMNTALKESHLPKGIIFVFHDAYSNSNIFYPLADFLKKYDLMIVGLDYRGHGRTGGQAGGKLGDISSFQDIYEDSIKIIKKFWKQYHVPVFLLGYDLGGLIAMNITNMLSEPLIEGLILISPIWKLEEQWKHIFLYPVLSVGTFFSKAGNHQGVLPEKLEDTYFVEYKQFAKNDPLRLKKMSYRMFKSMLDLIRKSHGLKRKLLVPCMIFQGTQDHMVNHYSVHRLYEKWPHPTKKIRLYENTGHNLLMDKYAIEIQQEILDFIHNLIGL